MKQMIEIDVVVTHPAGVTDALRDQLQDEWIAVAERLGCSVGGSFDLVREPTDPPRRPHSPTQ